MENKSMKSRMLTVMLSVLFLLAGVVSLNAAAVPEVLAAGVTTIQMDASLSQTVITKGESVTVYGSKSGNRGYLYAYYYKKQTAQKWSTIKGYSTQTSVSITPAAAVVYNVRVDAKDGTGRILQKVFTLRVNPALTNESSISQNVITKGNSVTLTGAAKGGVGSYSYAYYVKKASTTAWSALSKYSDTTTVTFKPAAAVNYDVMIKVKDSKGSVEKKTFELRVLPKLVNKSSVSSTSVSVGDVVVLKGAASGGSGKYTYSYSYKSGSYPTWLVMKGYSNTRELSCDMELAGKITLLVKVKDSEGNVASKTFTVTVSDSSIDNKADAVLNTIITAGMTEYDKVKAIHDWLVNNVEYDSSGYETGNIADTSYTAEGVLDTRIGVCDGYARAFLLLAERAGLEANRVIGVAAGSSGTAENHAWNQVKVDGKWYNIDVTWDDPMVSENYGDNLCYNYFLVPDSVIDKDHVAQSAKNACTAPQPTEKLIPVLLEEERSAAANTSLCESENELKTKVSQINVNFSNNFVMIVKTDLSQKEVLQIVDDNMPRGVYKYNYGARAWKLNGYIKVTIQIKVA